MAYYPEKKRKIISDILYLSTELTGKEICDLMEPADRDLFGGPDNVNRFLAAENQRKPPEFIHGNGKLYSGKIIKTWKNKENEEFMGNERENERENELADVVKNNPGLGLCEIVYVIADASNTSIPADKNIVSILLKSLREAGKLYRNDEGAYFLAGKAVDAPPVEKPIVPVHVIADIARSNHERFDRAIDDLIAAYRELEAIETPAPAKIDNADMKKEALANASNLNPIFKEILNDFNNL